MKSCPLLKTNKCSFWIGYQISLEALREAEELSHANRLKITDLQHRVDQLEAFITTSGLSLPEEE